MIARFRRLRTPLMILGLTFGLVVAAGGQEIPPDAVLQGFEPTGAYDLQIDGTVDSAARLFEAQRAGSVLLIQSDSFPDPVLLTPRSKQVELVAAAKVVEREDGRIDILSDAAPESQGEFSIDNGEVVFAVGDHSARLVQRPYLLGLQTGSAMVEHDASYGFRAGEYKPSGPMIRNLAAVDSPVRIRVYFGSWCPHCKEMVPKALSVEKALAGSNLSFEYYGLPRPFGDEPEALKADIRAVPTGVVYRDGKEIGRLEGGSWKIPELALKRLLQ